MKFYDTFKYPGISENRISRRVFVTVSHDVITRSKLTFSVMCRVSMCDHSD